MMSKHQKAIERNGLKTYEISYIVTTKSEIIEWLNDFIEWIENRDETIGGTIRPFENGDDDE